MNGDLTNIRSFRYSDFIATQLESFEGSSLNAKFNNLVSYCCAEIPNRKKELERINKQIDDKRNEYSKLCKELQNVSDLINTLKSVQYYGEIAARKAKSIAEDEFIGCAKVTQVSGAPGAEKCYNAIDKWLK
jgi:vacuolar-type H+-ATPase subunit I/STV1